MKTWFLASAWLLCSVSGAAPAADNQPATTRLGPSNDPNQIVCRRESVIGSRVTTQRVCRTRAEWAEHRRQYQQSIERAQRERPTHLE